MFNLGMLYHVFVCLVSGITGLVVFWYLFQKRKKGRTYYSRGLDYFSLLLGTLWVSVGLRVLFIWRGNFALSNSLYRWAAGPLGYLHLIPAFYYLGWSFFKEKKKQILFGSFFTVLALIGVGTLFRYGFSPGEFTYWGNNIIPNKVSNRIFIYGIFLPLFPCVIIEFIRRYKKWKENKSSQAEELLGFSFGFLLYSLLGIFDVIGKTQGWLVLAGRSITMLVPLIFYFSTTQDPKEGN